MLGSLDFDLRKALPASTDFDLKPESAFPLLGWSHKRVPLIIDHTKVGADLTNFPVLVKVPEAVFDDFASNDDRKRIAVTTDDGQTQCYGEIEVWEHAAKRGVLHVRVPSVSSIADTVLYLYWDPAHEPNTDFIGDTGEVPAKNVWDDNFVGVWHVATDPSVGAKDSTKNGLNGTFSGSFTTAHVVYSPTGSRGYNFGDSSARTITIPNHSLLQIRDNITAEAHIYLPAPISGWRTLFNKGYDIPYGMKAANTIGWRIAASGGDIAIGPPSAPGQGYHAFSGTYSTTSGQVAYLNGAQASTYGPHGTINDNTNPITIGYDTQYWPWPGHLYELRLSNIVRSAAWVTTTHYSLLGTLVSVGAVEMPGGILAVEDTALRLVVSVQDIVDALTRLILIDGLVLIDASTRLRVHDGLEFEDLRSYLAAFLQEYEDADLALRTLAESIDNNVMTWFKLFGEAFIDFVLGSQVLGLSVDDVTLASLFTGEAKSLVKLFLKTRSGLEFLDALLGLSATDGTMRHDAGLILKTTMNVPEGFSVVAQSLRTVLMRLS